MHNQRHPYLALTGLLFLCCLTNQVTSQTIRSFNQNSSRSNNAKAMISTDDRWLIGLRSGGSFSMKSNASSLFMGNGLGTDLYAHYYFGHIGLGLTSGWLQGKLSNSAINQFISDRKYPADALITKGDPSNSYFLFGPTVRFGNAVQIIASMQGGVFMNHSGRLIIAQNGATRPLYRFDEGSSSTAAGFSGGLQAAYPINSSTKFTIQSGLLFSRSSALILDPQGGIDQPREFNKDLRQLTASVGISKNLGSAKKTPKASGSNAIFNPKEYSIRRANKNVTFPERKDITIDEGGVHRMNPATQSDITIDESGVHRMAEQTGSNCGPVTITTKNADGSTNEMTFACPADAAAYQHRISMNVTVPKQTQGSTFGEKVQSGLSQAGSAVSQGASLKNNSAPHYIVGRISLSGRSNSGIQTNQSIAAVSSVSGLGGGSSGAASASYAATGRMAGNNNGQLCGSTTHFLVRDPQSGQASGQRNYQLFYAEEDPSIVCTACSAKSSNPLYESKGKEGLSPLHTGRMLMGGTTSVNGTSVQLMDKNSGAVMAQTVTEPDGTFFFSNVPAGQYILYMESDQTVQKDYMVELSAKKDMAGTLTADADSWLADISLGTGPLDSALAVLKSKTKSNQSNDRLSGSGMVWSPRSNLVRIPLTTGDVDGDGVPEFASRKYFQNGDMPQQEQIFSGGQPVARVRVHAIHNGSEARSTQTDKNGAFEFSGLDAGTYTIRTEQQFGLQESITVILNDEGAIDQHIVTSESNLKGDVKITVSQNSQSLRSINGINNSMPNRISTNFTVAKQQQNSGRMITGVIDADTDGDGSFETSWINFNGEIARLNIAPDQPLSISAPGTDSRTQKSVSGIKQTMQTQVFRVNPDRQTRAFPMKWAAPEMAARTRISGDPHVDQAGDLIPGNDPAAKIAKGKWRSEPVAIKTISIAEGMILVVTAHPEDFKDASPVSLNGLPPGVPVSNASIWLVDEKGTLYPQFTDETGKCTFTNVPVNTTLSLQMNLQIAKDEDLIITMSQDKQYTTISNVLKTKHDTAKNSIGNIR